MRKISKSRGDDDVVSSTNGSGSVAEADEVQPEQPPPEEDNKEDNDGKEDDLEKEEEDNGVEPELEDEEDEEPSAKKSKSKSKAKPKKKKSDKAKKAAKDEEYEVEKIIDSKRIKGKIYYLIRWKGYSADSDTWEPQHTVSCPDLISKYNEEKENSKNDSPKGGKKRKATSKKAVNKTPAKRTKSSWDSEKADENEEYEVERILEVQFKKNGQRQFLIHWKGWSSKFDSWEPENNLNCPDLIKKFMDKVEAARKVDSRNLRVAPGTTNRFTLQSPTSGRRLSKRRGQRQRVRYDDAE